MTSLVTAELGTKENPHPDGFIESISLEERKKYKGHWVVYKNGLRKIDKDNNLKKQRNTTIINKKVGWIKVRKGVKNQKLTFKICSERLELVGCKLLYDKEEFDNIYVNKMSKIKVLFECGCTKECKMGNCQTKIKRLLFKHSKTKEQIEKELENLSPAQISIKEFFRLYDINGMKCSECNSKLFKNKKYFESRFNKQTNEFKCVNCGVWKDYESNYGICCQDKSRLSRRHQCNTCSASLNKLYYNSLNFDAVIERLFKTCVTSHKSRLKKGIHMDCKPEDFITIQFLKNFAHKDGKKCCFTGRQINWKQGGIKNQGTFDRINSSITYIKTNVQCCIVKVNKMKMDLDDDEFIGLCGEVWMYRRGKDGYIDSENEKLKKEIEQLKKENKQLKEILNNKNKLSMKICNGIYNNKS